MLWYFQENVHQGQMTQSKYDNHNNNMNNTSTNKMRLDNILNTNITTTNTNTPNTHNIIISNDFINNNQFTLTNKKINISNIIKKPTASQNTKNKKKKDYTNYDSNLLLLDIFGHEFTSNNKLRDNIKRTTLYHSTHIHSLSTLRQELLSLTLNNSIIKITAMIPLKLMGFLPPIDNKTCHDITNIILNEAINTTHLHFTQRSKTILYCYTRTFCCNQDSKYSKYAKSEHTMKIHDCKSRLYVSVNHMNGYVYIQFNHLLVHPVLPAK